MAPHVFNYIAARDASPGDQDDTSLSPTLIAGIVVAAVIGLGAAVWLSVHAYRKRAVAKRKQRRGSAFTNFGATDPVDGEKSSLPSASAGVRLKDPFSREQLNANVIMPERGASRPSSGSRVEILQHYAAEGKLPRPFAPIVMPSAPTPIDSENPTPDSQDKLPTGRPASTASWLAPILPLAGGQTSHRFSAMSAVSSIASSGPGQKKVRQTFDPVLPDELVVSVGETLAFVQSYDDGWCIVGRDSVFKPGEVELGAIPAWCFDKPVKGVRAERPMRLSSLGVTVNLDPPPGAGFGRENAISWSNF